MLLLTKRAFGVHKATVVFAFVLLTGVGFIREARPQSATYLYISDMTAAADEKNNVTSIFVADERSGAIYSATMPLTNSGDAGRLGPGDFKPFFQSAEFPKPSALTYQNGKLIIYDRQNSALFELDVATKSVNVLLKGIPLSNPTSVAVSASGRIAVASKLSPTIVWYERTGESKALPFAFDSPSRLAFAGDDLLVLDGKGDILFVAGESIENGKQLIVSPLRLPDAIKIGIPQLKDFALYNGTYYFLGDKQIFAYVRSRGTAIPIRGDAAQLPASRIVADRRQLLLLDGEATSVSRLSRPVPVDLSFRDSDEKSNEALISVYSYLLARGSLPTREYVADRDYRDLSDLLLGQKMLFSPATEKNAAAVDNLVCRLNPDLCGPSPTPNPTAKITVRQGQKLVLPGVPYQGLVSMQSVKLGKDLTVSNFLANRFDNFHSKYDEDYLWMLNELKYSDTLELQLSAKVRGAIIASPPRKELALGEVLSIKAGQESKVGSLKDCGLTFDSSKSDSYGLPKQIKNSISSAAVEQLPRADASPVNNSRLNKLGIDKVEFELDEPNVELGDREALSKSPPPDQCLSRFVGPDNYLVLDIISVRKGRYRLWRNGSVIYLTPDQIKRLGLLGQPDPSGRWSLVVDEPYYIAYRAAALNSQRLFDGVIKAIDSASQVKPGSSQDILQLKNISLLLPTIRGGEITVLVSEGELADKASDFNKLVSSYSLKVRSAEGTSSPSANLQPNGPALSGQQSAPTVSAPGPSPTPLDVVKQNRELLLKTIFYRSINLPVEDLERVKIGIGEQPCSVDKDHPDFHDEHGTSAWVNESEITSAEPCPFPAPTGIQRVKTADEFSDKSDHGTHVAGLIAARNNSPAAPGLMPNARLYFLDASSPGSITPLIPNAYLNGVSIINFSTDFPHDANQTASISDLKDAMTNPQMGGRILFVVAVENSGSNLDAGIPSAYLASFLGDTSLRNNTIGVGSSIPAGGSEYVLGDNMDSKGQIGTGSSYGKKYVHLIAPGYDIYSSTRDKTYAEATGASLAAPQVSATAGMLLAQRVDRPERIKARLIYTADWFSQLRGKVWGGSLNVGRATWEIDKNLLTTETSRDAVESMELDESRTEMFRIKANPFTKHYDLDNGESPVSANLDIPFINILRATRLPDGHYRVIYLDQADGKRLTIILDAEISGKFPCKKLMKWDNDHSKFVDEDCSMYQNVDVSQILDYVARVPEVVKF